MRTDGGKMGDREAVCPFFRQHTRLSIACESPVPGSALRMTFADEAGKQMQYDVFCCGKYGNCEICRAVMEGYDEE